MPAAASLPDFEGGVDFKADNLAVAIGERQRQRDAEIRAGAERRAAESEDRALLVQGAATRHREQLWKEVTEDSSAYPALLEYRACHEDQLRAEMVLLQMKQKMLSAAERLDRAAHDQRVARQHRESEALAAEPRERARRLAREAAAATAAAAAAQLEVDKLDPPPAA